MKTHRKSYLFLFVLPSILAFQLPLSQPAETPGSEASSETDAAIPTRYQLNEIVSLLHYAKYFKEVLELFKGNDAIKSNIDLKSLTGGHLAEEFHKAQDNVRTQLDEKKRQELDRIRLITDQLKNQGHPHHIIRNQIKILTKHLDLKNLAQFGSEDLRKLILQANAELAIIDQRRRNTFKEYEMHKLLEFQELLKRLDVKDQEIVKNNSAALLAEHKNKKPMHMPASKDHLLKVWEERDRLNKENFNIKTFFHLHDLDGNGFMDEYEVKMILDNELMDYYDLSVAEYDPKERQEELERMREYFFNHVDVDKDHLISLDEFIENTKRAGFEDHLFWEGMKRVPIFTPEEFAAYAELNIPEVNRLIDEGKITLPLSGIVRHEKIPEEEST